MNATSVDIANLLSTAGIGVQGTTLFIGVLPSEPHSCIVVSDSGGETGDVLQTYKRPHVQVMVRGEKNGYAAAYLVAQSVYDELHAKGNFTQGGTFYAGIWALDDVQSLGIDENDRPLFSVNFRIHRR